MSLKSLVSLLFLAGSSIGAAIEPRAEEPVYPKGVTWSADQPPPFEYAHQEVNLNVKPSGGNKSHPLLWGIMFEDINHSGDGGIHGQLLMNNGFQGINPGLTAWKGVNDAKIAQDKDTPLTTAITSTLKIKVPKDTDEELVGAANTGYNGMPVRKEKYNNYFWMKGSYKGPVTVRLVGSASQVVYASQEVQVDSSDDKFTYYETSFIPEASSDGNNEWQFLVDPKKTAGQTIHLGLPQLFPPTYKDRKNGLRKDVAEFIEELHPRFLRLPGGNNMEGNIPETRWKWNETIGPVENRPGRQGTWGYANTDALGLHEYFEWCEDMKMEPVYGVWVGATIGGPIVEGEELKPYIDDVLRELEYILGDKESTELGKLRAQNGHPEPFNLHYVEIGNEDWLNGCEQYPSRYKSAYDALHAKYPQLQYISSVSRFDPKCYPKVADDVLGDLHHYLSPNDMVAHFNEFDNWEGRIIVGEYASTTNNDGTFTRFSTMQGACAEAVYMIAMERNSDRVEMSCYAPFFEHLDMNQWQPNMIINDNGPNTLTGSISYYVQKLFSNHAGEETLPVDSNAHFGPLYWSAMKSGNKHLVKVANYGDKRVVTNIMIPGNPANATVDLIASDDIVWHGPLIFNSPLNVKVQTRTLPLEKKQSGEFVLDLPPWAVAAVYTD
ncbi:hypothetical protein KEM56_000116 [Ascosphaera pollenicola]|nr:hypothetical protein KEM56_000116 [Ascosphaera pollenicola]